MVLKSQFRNPAGGFSAGAQPASSLPAFGTTGAFGPVMTVPEMVCAQRGRTVGFVAI
jgi:hypothetical protein